MRSILKWLRAIFRFADGGPIDRIETPETIILVGRPGGDFASIQEALDAIDAGLITPPHVIQVIDIPPSVRAITGQTPGKSKNPEDPEKLSRGARC